MKIAKLLLISILSIFLIGLVGAELGINQTPLKMTVDAKVDGKSAGTGLTNGEDLTRDAKPRSSVKITVNFENLYDKETQPYDLEDLSITATLEAIEDEGDEDIELEDDISRIRPERTAKKTFTFNIPLVVDEGTYTLNIDVEFDDTNPNATIDSTSMTLTLEVDKETHEVIINKAELIKNNLECSRVTTLNVQIMNIGTDEEDETVLEVTSDNPKINVKDSVTLSEDPFDEENVYSKTVTINAQDLKPGTYPIIIKAYRNTDTLEATKTVDLVVLECKEKPKEEEKEPIIVSVCGNNVVETGEECDDGNKLNMDGCSSLCKIEAPVTAVTPVTFEESFWDQYGTTVIIVVGELIFLFVILIIVAVALRKK